MKFLAIITLIISMAATFVPCCKYDGCEDEKTEQKGNCSPLSICATCAVAVVPAKTIEITNPPAYRNSFSSLEVNNTLPSYHSSFWQPPRLI